MNERTYLFTVCRTFVSQKLNITSKTNCWTY